MNSQFNKAPENLRKISMGAFLERMVRNPITNTELRQPMDWSKKPYGVVDLKMFEFPDGGGVAIAAAYIKGLAQYFYYAYGCEHEYYMTKKDGTLKEYKCQKCKRIKTVDSSD